MTLIKGRYRIIETIGRGGFGETYLTIDEDLPSKRQCVVKQLKPQRGLITEEMKERFEQEARVLERLGNEHDRIPKLFAYFEEGGEFYLVQEYIPGNTLRQLIEERKTANEMYVRDFLLDILPTLEFIHSKKIIHRDIKPDNIIIRESDGKPVLIDFGLVKQMMDSEVVSMTMGAGTIGFMAMEQLRGNPTKASDIYSLGMTAIAMLTTGVQLTPDSQTGEVYWKNLVKGGLSGELGEILDKATEFKLIDRYRSAAEMREALEGRNSLLLAKPQVAAIITPRPGDVTVGAAGIEFVFVPAGEFFMGSNEPETDKWEKRQLPIHRVKIQNSFWLGKYQVTQGQWESVMGSCPDERGWSFPGPNNPAERISWDDCKWFVEKLNVLKDGNLYRLPTEAEWEYACRAGTVGDFAGDLNAMGWYRKNSESRTHPVGQKQPNAFGLYDMHGNVWEWCQDRWHATYDGAPSDGSAWESRKFALGRVLRGGSWWDAAFSCRSGDRTHFVPEESGSNFGFRIVMIPARI